MDFFLTITKDQRIQVTQKGGTFQTEPLTNTFPHWDLRNAYRECVYSMHLAMAKSDPCALTAFLPSPITPVKKPPKHGLGFYNHGMKLVIRNQGEDHVLHEGRRSKLIPLLYILSDRIEVSPVFTDASKWLSLLAPKKEVKTHD